MKKKELLAGRKKLLEEIAALREENLQMRRRLAELPEAIPEPPVPDGPEEEIAPQHQFSRFPILRSVDERYNSGIRNQEAGGGGEDGNNISLAALAAHLRGYAAAHYGLCAPPDVFASLLGAMAVSDWIVLHGEKTAALPQAVAAALGQEAHLIPAHQSLLGSQDAVTKLYNETRLLRVLYEASYQPGPCFAVLDGRASPDEYTRLLQAAQTKPSALRLAADAWPGDPILLHEGALNFPENLWLFCTGEGGAVESPMRLYIYTEGAIKEAAAEIPYAARPLALSAARLRTLLLAAAEEYPVPDGLAAKIARTAAYLAERLDVSMDAKTERQMTRFMGVCLACGLAPENALDAFFYHKALRRMEHADPFLLRYELAGFRRFLDETFGKHGMPLTRAFTNNLQKND